MDKFELAKKAEEFAAKWPVTQQPRIQDWFMLAWARDIQPLKPCLAGFTTLNLGAGNRQIGNSVPLDLEHGWDAESLSIPYESHSIGGIYAHGFFEHLTPAVVIGVLKECERVLFPGAPLNIVVPHGMSELWHEELEHLSRFHEETIPNLFRNPYYQRGSEEGWTMHVHAQFILGVAWRNLALMIQLIKD